MAISLIASSLKINLTPSNLNNSLYCFIKEFFGSVKIFIKEASSRSSKVAVIGNRPMNSGIKPYFNKSSGSKFFIISPTFFLSKLLTSAPNPIDVALFLLEIILSRPAKAPPQINNILVVSTCKNSC